MRRISAIWPISGTPRSYDAVSILDFGSPSESSLPEARENEIVIRYGGWSIADLGSCSFVRGHHLFTEDVEWYDRCCSWGGGVQPGVYRLFFTPRSSERSSCQSSTPAILAATALIAHFLQTGEYLLQGGMLQAQEVDGAYGPVILFWEKGELRLNPNRFIHHYDDVWLSSCSIES